MADGDRRLTASGGTTLVIVDLAYDADSGGHEGAQKNKGTTMNSLGLAPRLEDNES